MYNTFYIFEGIVGRIPFNSILDFATLCHLSLGKKLLICLSKFFCDRKNILRSAKHIPLAFTIDTSMQV